MSSLFYDTETQMRYNVATLSSSRRKGAPTVFPLYSTLPTHNPKYQYCKDTGNVTNETNYFLIEYEVLDKPKSTVLKTLVTEINNYRDELLTRGYLHDFGVSKNVVLNDGTTEVANERLFQTRTQDMTNWLAIKNAATDMIIGGLGGDEFPSPLIMADNSKITLTATEISQVLTAMYNSLGSITYYARSLKDQIIVLVNDETKTLLDIKNLYESATWPEPNPNYVEFDSNDPFGLPR